MAVATKPKPTAKTRSAKSPGKSLWTFGQFIFKGNGETLMNEQVSPAMFLKAWSRIEQLIARGEPGKYTVAIETGNLTNDAVPSNGATTSTRRKTGK
jgi:hypothetical protein